MFVRKPQPFGALTDAHHVPVPHASDTQFCTGSDATYPFSQIADVTCFMSGTVLRAPQGDVPIETLKTGDLVETKDHGAQPIRWIGRSEVDADGAFAPVTFARGALGNTDPLCVSPSHRIILSGWRCAMVAGTQEVLAPAHTLVNGRDIVQADAGRVVYIHLAFDQHEIITSAGVPTESFHPDAMPLDALAAGPRATLLNTFPSVSAGPNTYGPEARPQIKPYEARLIRP